MTAYFVDNRNIADAENLIDIAESVGVPGDELRELAAAETEATTQLVIDDHNSAIESGVTAVPTIVLDDAVAVPGAQPVETWERLITRIESARA